MKSWWQDEFTRAALLATTSMIGYHSIAPIRASIAGAGLAAAPDAGDCPDLCPETGKRTFVQAKEATSANDRRTILTVRF